MDEGEDVSLSCVLMVLIHIMVNIHKDAAPLMVNFSFN